MVGPVETANVGAVFMVVGHASTVELRGAGVAAVQNGPVARVALITLGRVDVNWAKGGAF